MNKNHIYFLLTTLFVSPSNSSGNPDSQNKNPYLNCPTYKDLNELEKISGSITSPESKQEAVDDMHKKALKKNTDYSCKINWWESKNKTARSRSRRKNSNCKH